ncbi:hypothetical protein CS022_03295 [Veronia nyctiphanis]|uniref:Polymer-forming cytoskeletal protein n=1 Tax=Veronia nyctiphanis TaxID=1278244 RepID=A0A4Q0YTN4_9GAMM|nr:polymer-forming cytoskeletal protein [Veronia nyctiphanis]RXJ74607.1 hypothetical protein CS022_03295 [Veronia nyctiphanis]
MFKNKQETAKSLSVVAKNCNIRGEIQLEGDIQIDGFCEGSICNANSVVISATGHFSGEIRAMHVTINGLVEGTCIANDVDILSNGRMMGTVNSQQLTIEKGGCLSGENKLVEEEVMLSLIKDESDEDDRLPELKMSSRTQVEEDDETETTASLGANH